MYHGSFRTRHLSTSWCADIVGDWAQGPSPTSQALDLLLDVLPEVVLKGASVREGG